MMLFALRCVIILAIAAAAPAAGARAPGGGTHTANHAVIVSSSRYWFNYRHVSNALSIYQLLKSNGFTDDNIVLMLADEYAINPRNPFKNEMYAEQGRKSSVYYGADIQIDYRGEDVTVENFVNVLTGRHAPGGGLYGGSYNYGGGGNSNNKPLLRSDRDSNVLVYLTGHGGDQFFKFQDVEEIMADQLASVFRQMHRAGRYREVLLVADTCQAFTLGDKMDAPNVTVLGSSLKGESSYAHHSDPELGLSVIERYTYFLTRFIHKQGSKKANGLTLQQAMVDPYSFQQQNAHVGFRDDLSVRKMDEMLFGDFFAAAGTTSAAAAKKNSKNNHKANKSKKDGSGAAGVALISTENLRPTGVLHYGGEPGTNSTGRGVSAVEATTLTTTKNGNDEVIGSSDDSCKTASGGTCTAMPAERAKRHGQQPWEPHEPRFLALIFAFVLTVFITSRIL